jgi:hypothetical protein
LKVGKKLPLTLKQFEDFAAKLATRADSDRSCTVDLAARCARRNRDAPFCEFARGKAREADPHRKTEVDQWTPTELLDLVEAKGWRSQGL